MEHVLILEPGETCSFFDLLDQVNEDLKGHHLRALKLIHTPQGLFIGEAPHAHNNQRLEDFLDEYRVLYPGFNFMFLFITHTPEGYMVKKVDYPAYPAYSVYRTTNFCKTAPDS